MEVQYIVAISGGSLFVLLLFVFIGVFVRTKKREDLRRENISKMYEDKNLVRMEYDFAVYDEETERLISKTNQDGQLTIDDIQREASAPDENMFKTFDSEGMEEITGNYKPR